MGEFTRHIISDKASIKEALYGLNSLAVDSILFVVDDDYRLRGSLTDGDVRRGFLSGLTSDDLIINFIQPNPKFIRKSDYSIERIISLREKNFRIIPVVDDDMRIVHVINFRLQRSYLPIDAIIMAGGRGERLRPLTDKTPKPLLTIGNKPIIEHNIDRLISFGIDDFWISVGYMAKKIQEYFLDGSNKNVKIKYLSEEKPMGTIGSVSLSNEYHHDYILLSNSDILTNLDYEDFFLDFLKEDADLSVVTIPYNVNVPYAVFETQGGRIISFKEKPTYTYYSNGGIYLMRKSVINKIPKDCFFDATDLLQQLITNGCKVHSYPLRGYWIDIGKKEDYEKAQNDIDHIKF